MSIYVGINSYLHDTSVVMIRDGEVIAAVEEERFTGQRHAPGICLGGLPPYRAIEWLLEETGVALDQVDGFGHSCRLLEHRKGAAWQAERNEYELFARSLDPDLSRTTFFPHHLCHAASAFLSSGMPEALVITADGAGDSVSTAMYVGKGRRIDPLVAFPVTSSLGHLYTFVTRIIGLKPGFGKEGSAMALAAFGKPASLQPLIRRSKVGYVMADNWKEVLSAYETDYRRDFGAAASLARWAQEEVEETVLHLVKIGLEMTGLRRVCLAGGLFLNCVLNGKVATFPGVEDVFVPPAANDGGTALGAALLLASKDDSWTNRRLATAALGPDVHMAELEGLLPTTGLSYRRVENPAREAAALLASGKTVGWMQGRMEFGPRALGQRSILADPRDPNSAVVLSQIKKRESWRPYAVSVKAGSAASWFRAGLTSPFMTMADQVLAHRRSAIPAVVHVDGSTRLQTVLPSDCLWPVLDEFDKRVGLPMVVNTSLNCQTPILQSARSAVALLATSPLDALFVGSWLITKPDVRPPRS